MGLQQQHVTAVWLARSTLSVVTRFFTLASLTICPCTSLYGTLRLGILLPLKRALQRLKNTMILEKYSISKTINKQYEHFCYRLVNSAVILLTQESEGNFLKSETLLRAYAKLILVLRFYIDNALFVT